MDAFIFVTVSFKYSFKYDMIVTFEMSMVKFIRLLEMTWVCQEF